MHTLSILPAGDVMLTMVIPASDVESLEVMNMLRQRLSWDLDVSLGYHVLSASTKRR